MKMIQVFYKLVGKQVIPCSIEEFGQTMRQENRRVAEDFVGDIRISTVFLGSDLSFGRGRQLFFETMIFGGPFDQQMQRCSTYEEAEEMHKGMVELVKDLLAIDGEKAEEVLQISFNTDNREA